MHTHEIQSQDIAKSFRHDLKTTILSGQPLLFLSLSVNSLWGLATTSNLGLFVPWTQHMAVCHKPMLLQPHSISNVFFSPDSVGQQAHL
jgi:hypothetical protein